MKKITFLLKHLQNIQAPRKFVREAFVECVEEIVGVSLEDEEVKVSNDSIYVTSSPVVKSEIILKKDLILKSLKNKIGGEGDRVKYLN